MRIHRDPADRPEWDDRGTGYEDEVELRVERDRLEGDPDAWVPHAFGAEDIPVRVVELRAQEVTS